MQVAQVISGKGAEVFSITPEATVGELVQALNEYRVGALLVIDNASTLAGIVSERDVVRALARDSGAVDHHVRTIMTADVVSVPPTFEVADLMGLMTERRIRHVPVIDDHNALVGLVSIGDVVKVRMDELETERAALVDYITHGG